MCALAQTRSVSKPVAAVPVAATSVECESRLDTVPRTMQFLVVILKTNQSVRVVPRHWYRAYGELEWVALPPLSTLEDYNALAVTGAGTPFECSLLSVSCSIVGFFLCGVRELCPRMPLGFLCAGLCVQARVP